MNKEKLTLREAIWRLINKKRPVSYSDEEKRKKKPISVSGNRA